ncbi:MAG: ATP-dependent DNA ligase [Spirochaetales bacterium]|nr:ATP-dependent DNA ligase [Spirochaetales bacterium]
MKLDKTRLQQYKGYLTGDVTSVEATLIKTAESYKRQVAGNYLAVNNYEINKRLPEDEFFITRKVDGEMQVVFFDGENVIIINGHGKARASLPCLIELESALKEAGLSSCILAGELHDREDESRKRIYDLLSALVSEKGINDICLSVFDIIEIDGKQQHFKNYGEKHQKIKEIIGKRNNVFPVELFQAANKQQLQERFKEKIDQGAEGLVVHCNYPRIFKIKPKHTIDAVVVGYSESEEKGSIRTLLVALIREENKYQIIGKVSNGLTDQQKMDLFIALSKKHVPSSYTETDSNKVAFHMIEPGLVVEMGFNDILTESFSKAISNPVLVYTKDSYFLDSVLTGIRPLFPVFERFREDKKADAHDVRFSQITDLFYIESKTKQLSPEVLPKSEILSREVYTKEAKNKIMAQKFVVFKTNKEDKDERYPAYVFFYTNFSSGRKDPLNREVRVSNDKDQIFDIMEKYKAENIKKGWEKVPGKN